MHICCSMKQCLPSKVALLKEVSMPTLRVWTLSKAVVALQRTEASENCKGCGAELLPVKVTLQSQASPTGNTDKTAQAARHTANEARIRSRSGRRKARSAAGSMLL